MAILMVLSLVSAPATVVAASAAVCTMAGSMDRDADHSKMKCCTPICAVSCPPAVMPMGGLATPADEATDAPLWAPANKSLHSIDSAGLDPPPKSSRA